MKKQKFLMALLISGKVFSMELDLEKAVDIANENNRSLKISEIDVQQQELSYNEAYKEGLPNVSIEGDYTGSEEARDGRSDSNFENSVILSQPLYSGGKIYYGTQEARQKVSLYETLYEKDTNNMRLGVVDGYVKIRQLEQELEVHKASKKEKTEELNRQKEFFGLGMIDRSEILKVESSLYQTETDIIDTSNNIETEKIAFKKLLGIPLDEKINLSGIGTRLAAPGEAVDLVSDKARVLSKGLDVEVLNKNMEIAEARKNGARSEFLPELDLEFGYVSLEEESFSDSADTGDWEWRTGVSFKWDIFNFGSSFDTYERAKNDTVKASIERADGVEDVKKDVTSAYLNMGTIYSLIDTKKKIYETSRETYRIDKEKYANRLIDTLDYLEAESALREAKVDYINSQLDYYLAYEQYLNTIK